MSGTEARCIHELLTNQCIICKPRAADWWDAMYETSCPSCSQPIHIGDRVRWAADGLSAEHARHARQ